MNNYWLRLALGLTMLAAGCGKGGDGTGAGTGGGGGGAAGGTPSTGAGTGATVAAPAEPDKYAQDFVNSLASGDIGRVWTALPSKYQADVKALISDAAAQMDAEVYDKAFAVAAKATQVLKTKKDLLLESAPVKEMAPPGAKEMAGPFWSPVVTALESLTNSEIKTLDGLKNVEPGRFLSSTGGQIFQVVKGGVPQSDDVIRKVKESKVTIVKQDGDTATLEVLTEGETTPDKLELTRVEGKWLPTILVAQWDSKLAAMRADIDAVKLPPEMKTEVLNFLKVADASLDKMLTTTDQIAFDVELFAVMKAFTGLKDAARGPATGLQLTPPGVLNPGLPGGGIPGQGIPPGLPGGVPLGTGVPPALPGALPTLPSLTPPGLTPPVPAPQK